MNWMKKALILFNSQQEFAKAIGMSKQSVSHWRHGRRQPSKKVCLKIVEVTNGYITLEDLCN